MTGKSSTPKPQDTAREARLKAALKANLARRKAQTRARGGTNDKAKSTDKD